MKRDKFCTRCGNSICSCSFFDRSEASYCGYCGQELEDCSCRLVNSRKRRELEEEDDSSEEEEFFCDECGQLEKTCICHKRKSDSDLKTILYTGRSNWRAKLANDKKRKR